MLLVKLNPIADDARVDAGGAVAVDADKVTTCPLLKASLIHDARMPRPSVRALPPHKS